MTNILNLELVPKTSWLSNVRSNISKKQWSIISKQVRSAAYDICEICHATSEQSLDCHEVWTYDDEKQIQKLTGMVALCKDCHSSKHFGLAQIQGKGERALLHFMKINKLTRKQAEKEIKKAFEVWVKRSQKEWTLDISLLKDYGIDVSKLQNKQEKNKLHATDSE